MVLSCIIYSILFPKSRFLESLIILMQYELYWISNRIQSWQISIFREKTKTSVGSIDFRKNDMKHFQSKNNGLILIVIIVINLFRFKLYHHKYDHCPEISQHDYYTIIITNCTKSNVTVSLLSSYLAESCCCSSILCALIMLFLFVVFCRASV